MKTQNSRNPLDRSPLRSGLLFIALAFGYFALSPAPNAFGVSPPPDGGYAGNNTAEGADALFSLTSGIDNNALGFQALYHNNTGNFNTAEGFRSLFNNISGANNTATGVQALYSNNNGNYNTAMGVNALYRNISGVQNTAVGAQALFNNTTINGLSGQYNTALGFSALYRNTRGAKNTATGWQALYNNTDGQSNTANGYQALFSNNYGLYNTANGYQALYNSTDDSNIALGTGAGFYLMNGSHNIYIGNTGNAAESGTIRIGGDFQTATYIKGISGKTATGGAAVFVTANGKLGTVTSSRRFKKDIADMDAASEALLALRPVTFRYKPELDKAGIPQYGLVAEEVAEVNPDLVVRDEKGEIYTVRYEAVNAMLLNEFLKEHRKVDQQGRKMQEQEATIAQLKANDAAQLKEIKALAATSKEQASEIQKVSARLELQKAAPQTVLNNE